MLKLKNNFKRFEKELQGSNKFPIKTTYFYNHCHGYINCNFMNYKYINNGFAGVEFNEK